MKFTPRCSAALAVFVSGFASIASAHPGHDGHELTWDFGHLAAHPAATAMWAAIMLGGAWGLARGVSAIARSFRHRR